MFCKYCGKQIDDNAAYCPYCGSQQKEEVVGEVVSNTRKKHRNETIAEVGLVFCIVNTVIAGFALLPLAWMLPMTLGISDRLKEKREISIAYKVCTMLFVSVIGGLLLLLADELED